ncbi:unnamed protein product, partial [Sphagnum compactum]
PEEDTNTTSKEDSKQEPEQPVVRKKAKTKIGGKKKSKKKLKTAVSGRHREYLVKFMERSYWDVEWVTELQLDVFHPQMFKHYTKKYDMEEPPKYEEPLDENDGRSKRIQKHHKHYHEIDKNSLEERYYKYGIKPEWLFKWRELAYDQATWEEEVDTVVGLKEGIEYYNDLRNAFLNIERSDKKGKKKGRKR